MAFLGPRLRLNSTYRKKKKKSEFVALRKVSDRLLPEETEQLPKFSLF